MVPKKLPPKQPAHAVASPQARPAKAPKRRSSRLSWLVSRLLVVVILLVVVVFFAPSLLATRGVWKKLLAIASPDLAKQVDAKSVQLGWLSPLEIRDAVVLDVAGQPMATVGQIKSQKSLLALALGYPHLGTVEIVEPQAKVVLRADGSNVEDFLAKLPKQPAKPAKPLSSNAGVGVTLVVSKGLVGIEDRIAGRIWRIEDLAAQLESPSSGSEPLAGKVSATLKGQSENGAASQLAAEFSLQPAAKGKTPLGTGQAQVTLQGFPTEALEGALRRFVADVRPSGPLTMQVAGAMRDNGAVQVLINQITTPGIAVSAPKFLSTDHPTLVINNMQGAVELAGNRLTVPNLQVTSNLITVGGKGAASVPAGKTAAGGAAGVGGDLEVNGQINLAELARQLPATIHLRSDAQVASGAADFAIASQAAASGRHWTGQLKTRDIRGVAAGRQIQFDQPLEVDFDLNQTPAGPVLEKLVGQASFLRLEGRGALADGSIRAEADLDKLVSELDRLIDWGDTRMEGKLTADVRWKQDANTGWSATADAVARDFKAVFPKMAPWQEQSLHLAANVDGNLAGPALAQINRGKLLVEASADRLDAELMEPVKSPSATSVWLVRFALKGNLQAWAARAQAFVPLNGLRVAGGIDATGAARVSPQDSELMPTSIQLNQLDINRIDATGNGIAIREPRVVMETSGAWSQSKSTLALGSTTFASSSLAFRADGVKLTLGNQPSLVGLIDLRGDLAKLSAWSVSAQPRQSAVEGGLTGRVELGYQGQTIAANWTADVDSFRYLVAPPQQAVQRTSLVSNARPQWQTLWQEPKVNFAGQGKFDPASGTLKIDRTSVAASCASLAAGGTIAKLTLGAPEVDLNGEIAYDLAQVTQQLQSHAAQQAVGGSPNQRTALPYGLDTLQLVGNEKRQFVLKGPIFAATGNLTSAGRQSVGPALSSPATFIISDALAGEASLGWQSAAYLGLLSQAPSDFRAKLANGIVQIGPLDVPLSEGKLTAAPRVMLNSPDRAVVFDRAPVLQNVRISPEMCSLWMKYVAPMLADATRAEGKFSLSLEGANVPMTAPLTSNAAGTLAIESAQIGPGPMLQQLTGVLKQVRSFFDGGAAAAGDGQVQGWLTLPKQDVLFEVRDGVVKNQGFKIAIGDVVISTEGTVGLETQQINLVATIPLLDSWFKRTDGIFAALKGKTVPIGISGTLSQPRLDMRALENLTKQLAGSAVRGAIEKQFEKGLSGLGLPGTGAPGTGAQVAAPQGAGPQGADGLLQRGEGLLQGEIGQGLRGLFGPKAPAPNPAPPR
jgi:hypothetical protein